MSFSFSVKTTCGRARRGTLTLNHGTIETPIFMPVGTYGSVKAMAPNELTEIGSQIILGNTFHLWLRPGLDVIGAHGGLHDFMQWHKPILTDSGGFQVFSLGELRKITEEGVKFSNPINGAKLFLTPEISMQIQRVLNSDVTMVLDECTPYKIGDRPATEAEAAASMRMSLRWAKRSKDEFERDAHEPSLGEALEGRIRTPGKSQHALRDRAGRHVRAPARRVARGPQGNRLSRLRRGRSLRGRAQGRDAPHHGRDRAQASRRPSPLSDGRGHARRPRGARPKTSWRASRTGSTCSTA